MNNSITINVTLEAEKEAILNKNTFKKFFINYQIKPLNLNRIFHIQTI